MSAAALYPAHLIKRHRSTRSEVERRRSDLFAIVSAMRPMTVRQVFYQATVRGIVDKTEGGYARVQTDLVQMRRAGLRPYSWLADNTRWQRKPLTFSDPQHALAETAKFYRKALWADADSYVELWLVEKDALSGVLMPVTSAFDVPLAAEYIASLAVPAFVYHLGDFDPSGVNAGEKIEQTLREMAPDAELYFERLAVNPEQIAAWDLPSRPTKASDSRAKRFGAVSVELDAIEPDRLRGLVHSAIERHLPADHLRVPQAAEESERALLHEVVAALARAGAR